MGVGVGEGAGEGVGEGVGEGLGVGVKLDAAKPNSSKLVQLSCRLTYAVSQLLSCSSQKFLQLYPCMDMHGFTLVCLNLHTGPGLLCALCILRMRLGSGHPLFEDTTIPRKTQGSGTGGLPEPRKTRGSGTGACSRTPLYPVKHRVLAQGLHRGLQELTWAP